MPSSKASRALGFAVLLAASAWELRAGAQQQAHGFAVERFYPSAPGGGWFVMDALDMRGGLGGAMELQGGYALNPLRVTDGVTHLAVVSNEALADFGFAVTLDRWRLYLDINAPLVIEGQEGPGGRPVVVGNYAFTAPSVSFAETPDLLSDVRAGLDVRLVGGPKSPFRLGAGAQLWISAGDKTSDYDTDGTYRGMLRVLFAGDIGRFTYAGQLGVHIRPLDDSATPGSPRGSELLFGLAAGARLPVGKRGTDLVVGPELFGETAFSAFMGTTTTGVEGLLSGRLEGTADDGAQFRFKLGTGAGLNQHFGAPEWRIVFGIELFDHNSDRDKDGVSDSRDACPDTPGIKTKDPKTNGCPIDRDGEHDGDAPPSSVRPPPPPAPPPPKPEAETSDERSDSTASSPRRGS
jgi:OOP family OmpA-OmpF porin